MDRRGHFVETWRQSRYAAIGISDPFVQDNLSWSTRGGLRGRHFSRSCTQGKLVMVTRGRQLDVAVDVRRGSPYFGQWFGVELSAENHQQLWILPGLPTAFTR